MPTDPQGRLAPGTTLAGGMFTIEAVLGQGGAGLTYRAQQASPRRAVAIKELFPQGFVAREGDAVVPAGGAAPEMFVELKRMSRHEADALATFNHASIVHVHQVFEENGTLYIVLEFLDGEMLASLAPMADEARLRAWIDPVCDALAQVHARGVLHRDISPQNIIMRTSGVPALLDFGAARLDRPEFTRIATQFSSFRDCFSPAEQHGPGEEHTPAIDVYALAATVYYVATGERPVDARIRQAQVLNGEPDPLKPLAAFGLPGLSAAFAAGVDRGLALRRDDRPQSIADFREGLGGAPAPAPVRAQRRGFPLRPVLAAGAALPAAAAVVIWLGGFLDPDPAPEPGPPPEVETWRATFGASGADAFADIVELPGGSYLAAGHIGEGEFGGQDGWVMRLDARGAEEWRRILGGPGDDALAAIAPAPDGTFLLAGHRDGEGWAVRLDAEGREVWSQGYGPGRFAAATPLASGGFALAGWRAGEHGDDGWVVGIADAGAEAWQSTHGGPGEDRIAAVTELAGGDLVLAGTSAGADTGTDGWALRIAPDGTEIWERRHGNRGHDGFAALVPGPDGEISVAGWIESAAGDRDAWMMHLDGNGAELWRRRIGAAGLEHFTAMARTEGGAIYLAGWVEEGGGGTRDALVARLDDYGVPQWQRRIASPDAAAFAAILPRADGGIALAGYLAGDAWAVTLDAAGRDAEGGPD